MKTNKTILKLFRMLRAFEQISTEKGTLITDGTAQVGSEAFIDGGTEFVPAPDGDYVAGDTTYTVAGGEIVAIVTVPEEEPVIPEEAEEEGMAEEAPEEAAEEPVEEPVEEEPAEDIEALKKRISELEAEVEGLKAENEELKAKVEAPVKEEGIETENKFARLKRDGDKASETALARLSKAFAK